MSVMTAKRSRLQDMTRAIDTSSMRGVCCFVPRLYVAEVALASFVDVSFRQYDTGTVPANEYQHQ